LAHYYAHRPTQPRGAGQRGRTRQATEGE
jgi:hypothetical protein